MFYIFTIIYMAITSRLSGSGFGQKWGVSWLPEVFFAAGIGAAHAYAWYAFGYAWYAWIPAFILATVWSYVFMQSATWMFLRWTEHEPNKTRKATLKPIVDFIAKRFGYELGDEGYSWIAAGLKGFLIGLPVGGIPLMILWPLGYEIGSHAKGRTEKWIDPHTVSELMAGVGAGISIVLFLMVMK